MKLEIFNQVVENVSIRFFYNQWDTVNAIFETWCGEDLVEWVIHINPNTNEFSHVGAKTYLKGDKLNFSGYYYPREHKVKDENIINEAKSKVEQIVATEEYKECVKKFFDPELKRLHCIRGCA